jgi:hypothetical protein
MQHGFLWARLAESMITSGDCLPSIRVVFVIFIRDQNKSYEFNMLPQLLGVLPGTAFATSHSGI